jgi:hypothetical protein
MRLRNTNTGTVPDRLASLLPADQTDQLTLSLTELTLGWEEALVSIQLFFNDLQRLPASGMQIFGYEHHVRIDKRLEYLE